MHPNMTCKPTTSWMGLGLADPTVADSSNESNHADHENGRGSESLNGAHGMAGGFAPNGLWIPTVASGQQYPSTPHCADYFAQGYGGSRQFDLPVGSAQQFSNNPDLHPDLNHFGQAWPTAYQGAPAVPSPYNFAPPATNRGYESTTAMYHQSHMMSFTSYAMGVDGQQFAPAAPYDYSSWTGSAPDNNHWHSTSFQQNAYYPYSSNGSYQHDSSYFGQNGDNNGGPLDASHQNQYGAMQGPGTFGMNQSLPSQHHPAIFSGTEFNPQSYHLVYGNQVMTAGNQHGIMHGDQESQQAVNLPQQAAATARASTATTFTTVVHTESRETNVGSGPPDASPDTAARASWYEANPWRLKFEDLEPGLIVHAKPTRRDPQRNHPAVIVDARSLAEVDIALTTSFGQRGTLAKRFGNIRNLSHRKYLASVYLLIQHEGVANHYGLPTLQLKDGMQMLKASWVNFGAIQTVRLDELMEFTGGRKFQYRCLTPESMDTLRSYRSYIWPTVMKQAEEQRRRDLAEARQQQVLGGNHM